MDTPEPLESPCPAQRHKQQCVHELSAAEIRQVSLVGCFGFVAGAESVQRQVSQVLSIVVVASHKSVETAGQAVYGRVVFGVIFVWEDNMEIAIELGGSEFSAVSRHEGKAYQIGLGAVADNFFLDFVWQGHEAERWFLPARRRSHIGDKDGWDLMLVLAEDGGARRKRKI